jgi:hypothetical protein
MFAWSIESPPGKRGEDEGHSLHAHVTRARSVPKVDVLVEEGPQPELLGEGGRQEETSVSHRVAAREGY